MRTVNITANGAESVPPMVIFQAAPGESFDHGEVVIIQLIDNSGTKVGQPEQRSTVKTHSEENGNSAWYEAYIPGKIPKHLM